MGHGEEPNKAELFREQIHRSWSNTPGITDLQRIDIINENIGPDVRSEIKCLPIADRQDPRRLLDAIVGIFGERRTPAQLRDVLRGTRQYPGEAVRLFSHRIMAAFDALQKRQTTLKVTVEPDSALLEQFIDGLQDPTLSRYLSERKEDTPNIDFVELRKIAIRWSRDEQPSSLASTPATVAAIGGQTAITPTNTVTTSDVIAPLVNLMKEMMTQQQAFLVEQQRVLTSMVSNQQRALQPQPLVPTNSRRGAPPRRPEGQQNDLCYHCNRSGHFAKHCPRRQGNGNRS